MKVIFEWIPTEEIERKISVLQHNYGLRDATLCVSLNQSKESHFTQIVFMT